ncbi:DsbA family protein [Alkalimarinus alittae]|uniref:DsbA family protein n=1 Tax=Alkalimarinus alittae TaxID=2961619 RepID=A0ABY6N256_9ALTE|nr:hypothetical protein [Alkalimarinus alittae]UZE96153.1 hypothetical protein NKI27_19225 [Alkalimarinus alittae]
MIKCDPDTGACLLPNQDSSADSAAVVSHEGLAVRYIGDPMCSWCWGISPSVAAVEDFCESEGIEFSVTMGGLRVGGGEPWSERFKTFLRNEWQKINQATGQPFGYTLLEVPQFDYDTEPACRAVATVKLLQVKNSLPQSIILKFFSAIQHKFYVEGQDPKITDFYASICRYLTLDFDEFSALFDSSEALQSVQQEFIRCRQWGVRSFPTLLLERHGKWVLLAEGYATAEQLLSLLRKEVLAESGTRKP